MAMGRTRRLLLGEVLYSKGEPGDEMYLVLQGRVRLVENRFAADDRGAVIVEQGGFFGESALLGGGTRERTAIAAELTVVLCIDRQELRELVKEQPALAERILQHLRSRMAEQRRSPAAGAARRGRPDDAGDDFIPLVRFDEESPYLFTRTLTCPLCEVRFEVEAVRTSRLAIETRYPDFRVKYRGVEPLWYRYPVCPRCLYAGKRADFEVELTEAVRQALSEDTQGRKSKFGIFDFRVPRDASLAVTSARLAERCFEVAGKPTLDRALAALHALWLYEDIGDKKQARAAMTRATDLYVQAYNEIDTRDNPKLEQRIAYLIGWLSHRLYRNPDAMAYMLKAAKLNQKGDKAVTELVRDALPAIRSRHRSTGSADDLPEIEASS